MFFAYVIYSVKFNRYYKGHCENLKNRLSEHNAGRVKSTKAFIPWEIYYFEEYASREKAITREKYFKSGAGRRFIKSKLMKSPGSPPA
ncbi:MAG: GIY-YIG nuclease family protein [Bacteroidetes bacterium]|nr:GIY-YIG nuclease family protein [Bacteroidota bacterium]